MKALILAVVSLLVLINAQNTSPPWDKYAAFVADFLCTADQFGSGVYRGKFTYDWTTGAMQIQYKGAQNYVEFYQFNPARGYDTTADLSGQFAFQYLYKYSQTCPCETTGLNYAMPALFPTSIPYTSITKLPYWISPGTADTLVKGDVTVSGTKYFANSAFISNKKSFILTSQFWVNNDGTPGAFSIDDDQNRKFLLYNVVDVPPGQTGMIAPKAGCKCGKQMDICLSLDRSGSISRSQWTLEYQFTQNLIGAFSYGPLATNLGIVNWNAAQWTTLDITSGTSPDVVNSAVGSMTCCPGASSSSCCCCGTPIGGGIWLGGNCLSKSTRGRAQKVLILLTDGCQNHLFYPPSTAVNCGCATEKICATNATCVGDITTWYNWVQQNIPGTRIIVVGVGGADTICKEQLLLAAGSDQQNVYNPDSWSALLSLVDTITATACSADNIPCPGCCGLCTCGQCIPPDECISPDACNNGTLDSTGCCTTTSIVCPEKPCTFAYCDKVKGCQNDPLKCTQPDTTCVKWTCNDSYTCSSGPNPAGVGDPQCTTQVYCDCPNGTIDCNDNNNCTQDICSNCKCSNPPITCPASDACNGWVCKPKEGCVVTVKKCDDRNNCTIDTCDTKTGCKYTNVTCPKPDNICQYTSCDVVLGCGKFPLDCTTKGYVAANCTVPACNISQPGGCYNEFICAAPPPTGSETGPDTVVLVSTLTTAAVAGIVIAAVLLAAGLGGGAAVAIAQVAAGSGAVVTASNPLYAGAGIGGDNPLNQG